MNVRTAVLLSLAFCSAQAQDQPVMPKADLIFVHGNVYTGVVEASSFKSIKRAQAIAVRGDRIEANLSIPGRHGCGNLRPSPILV